MFAFVCPGRSVQQVLQVPESPERFVAVIDNAQDLNHLCIFTVSPFPEGYGCTIHLDAPGKGWQLIGALSNAKPSAIFRLRGTFIPSSHGATFSSAGPSQADQLNATLGILCEPLETVEAHVVALGGAGRTAEVTGGAGGGGGGGGSATSTELVLARAGTPESLALVAQKVALNLLTYAGGFGTGAIDLGVIENWYKNFERKLKSIGPGFLFQDN